MKIGFSFGRCLRDIVNGEVAIEDVLCIIGRTRMLTEEDVDWVVTEYRHRFGYLQGLDKDLCHKIGKDLFLSGRILEPRANGVSAMSVPADHLWMDLFPTVIGVENEGVVAAWEAYRMMIGLTAQLPEIDESHLVHSHKRTVPEATEQEQLAALNVLINAI